MMSALRNLVELNCFVVYLWVFSSFLQLLVGR